MPFLVLKIGPSVLLLLEGNFPNLRQAQSAGKRGKNMRQVVPMDDYGLFVDSHDTARVDSLYVAKFFEKEHKDVLRAIRNLDCSEEFNQRNFAPAKYRDAKGENRPCYHMTRDGFVFLAMGFTGKKAAHFKEFYINRFNEMEAQIRTLVNARQQFPKLTKMVRAIHENPKPYHYSNECDLLNRIVLGMSAKQFRTANGIGKGESIRPYLTDEQIEALDYLQDVDIGLLVAVPDYNQRKIMLQWSLTNMNGGNAHVLCQGNHQ